MTTGDNDALPPAPAPLTASWQAAMLLGALTLILGIIVTAHPTGSLNVLAVLLGILLILSGIFHLIRVFDQREPHRIWLGIAGLLFIVIGVVLIRHLNLTVAAIGLLVGISWIVSGVAGLMAAFSGVREGALWWGAFGGISLIAGIVVVASPVTSVTVLAVLLGIWFIIMGIFEIILALMVWHALSSGGQGPSSWPADPDAAAS